MPVQGNLFRAISHLWHESLLICAWLKTGFAQLSGRVAGDSTGLLYSTGFLYSMMRV
jgi:hypothetical protein